MKVSRFTLLLALSMAGSGAWAKLPPPSEEAQIKAEAAKAKLADQAKIDAEQLAQAQDRVAAAYLREQKARGVVVKPTPTEPAAAPLSAPASAGAAAAPVAAPK